MKRRGIVRVVDFVRLVLNGKWLPGIIVHHSIRLIKVQTISRDSRDRILGTFFLHFL